MSSALQVAQGQRVVYFRVLEPVALGEASTRLAWALVDACRQVEEADEPLVAVALVGVGPAFFVVPPSKAADCDAAGDPWREATGAVARLAPPTVAAIGGDALGSAWELALACDLRVATAEARVGSPEIRWGRNPAAGGTQRLARLAGLGLSLRLLLLGEAVPAPEAFQLGLIHRVTPTGALESCLEQLLGELRSAAPVALAYVKEAAHGATQLPLEDGFRLEADLAALLQTTHDRAEGIAAFLERRSPRFQGR